MAEPAPPPKTPNILPPDKAILPLPRVAPETINKLPPFWLMEPVKPLFVVPTVTVPDPLLVKVPDPLREPLPPKV